jgi:hypothetical protein
MDAKRIGYVLIGAGFLAGAWFGVAEVEGVSWWGAVPSLLVGLAGVAVVQSQLRATRSGSDAVRTSIERIEGSLESICAHIAELDRDKERIDVYEIHARIDDLFMVDLDTFVDNRDRISHAYGLQAYADVMSAFATGERYLNRCWSASTDGYVDEVAAYLGRAHTQFDEALSLLRRCRETATGA